MRDAVDLILASASPRRRELLALTRLRFEIDAPDVDEHTGLGAKAAVQELSRRKALAGAARHPGQVVLAADTLVAIDDRPLGKPADEADACRMLRALADRWHQVCTGVTCVDRDGGIHSGVDVSDVRFGPMTDEEIEAYVRTGEPMDKAGAYALQGGAALYIEEMRGSPSGVIGLPMHLTHELLLRCGLTPLKG